ncbi:hypothetical protein, partial [uncultured Flavobacterium sp.]|uniref:hypothetical protein n=1 Tax=uncultured Flavobacterium sp. TaxID=165435 RepID=UPI002594EC14
MRRIALLTVGLFFVGLSFAEDSGGNNALFGGSNGSSSNAANSTSTDVMVPPIVTNSGGGTQQQSLISSLNNAQGTQFSNDVVETPSVKQAKTRSENKVSDYDPFVSNV